MAVKFDDVVRGLIDAHAPLARATVRRLSDLSEEDRDALAAAWGRIPGERRRQIVQHVAALQEDDFELDFGALLRIALTDLNGDLRQAAIEASWADETPALFNRLMPMAAVDMAVPVRAAALTALGRFILQAELGKFDPFTARQAEQLALRLYRDADEDVEVRRRALEAVSNCSRPEVEPLIDEAYRSDDVRMRASAVFAMGRSCNEAWAGAVLEELGSDDPTIRFEAVRAAGELELEEAVPQIASHLLSDDREIAEMSIWALGEIGSNEARRLLGNMVEYAEERGDDALLELVEDALAQASLSGAGFLMDAD